MGVEAEQGDGALALRLHTCSCPHPTQAPARPPSEAPRRPTPLTRLPSPACFQTPHAPPTLQPPPTPHTGASSSKRGAPSPSSAALLPRVRALLQSLLTTDLQGQTLNPFLVGRALWAAAKLSKLATPEQAAAFLQVRRRAGLCKCRLPSAL